VGITVKKRFLSHTKVLSAIEHPGGEGVAVELFEMGLESFIVSPQGAG
jgi:hypothetical protein